jgi:hypothetical protein
MPKWHHDLQQNDTRKDRINLGLKLTFKLQNGILLNVNWMKIIAPREKPDQTRARAHTHTHMYIYVGCVFSIVKSLVDICVNYRQAGRGVARLASWPAERLEGSSKASRQEGRKAGR